MSNNQEISWTRFQTENNNASEAFQTLAMRLLAYDLDIPSWTFTCPKTSPGVECDPIEVDGKFQSFQAKFYSDPANGWKKLKESLETTCKQISAGNYSLDVCHVFVNWDKPVKKRTSSSKKAISKIDECEKIAKGGGFALTWTFEGQIIERLQNDHSAWVQKLSRQFFTFPSQPQLDHPENSGSIGIAKYHYAAKSRLEYVERAEVVMALKRLIDDDRPFVWHTLVGSAGVGKSRSILEYCNHHLDETWKWGWLRHNCSHNFASWLPDSNHVIVVDYAMGRGNQLFRLLNDCVSCATKLLYKVRVVVAERMIEPWMQTATSQPTNGAAIADAALLHDENNPNPRPTWIRPFKKENQLRLAQVTLDKYPKLDLSTEQLVSQVLEVDDQFRPLMVSLCAEHLNRGEDLSYAYDLLNDYIDHQRNKIWQPNNITEVDESNTTLVTMCQGLSDSISDKWTQEAQERVAQIEAHKHSIILGSEQIGNTLRPMEPDIVGELHALNVCFGSNPLDVTKARSLIFEANLLNPKGLIGFLFRAASDFPAHETFKKIIGLNLNPELKVQIIHFLILGLNKPGPFRNRPKIAEFLNQARNIVEKDATLNSIQNYSAAITNASHGYADATDIDLIKSHLTTIRKILEQANDPMIFRSYVGALQNLFAGDRLAPLMYDEKVSYIQDLRNLVGNPGFSQDSFRTFVGILSSLFAKALLHDEFAAGTPSQVWLAMLESLLKNEFSEDEHVRAVVANMLKSAAEKMHSKQNYIAHSALVEKIVELDAYLREQEVTQIASQLFNYFQAKRNGGNANPDVERLLGLLAKTNKHAAILQSHLN